MVIRKSNDAVNPSFTVVDGILAFSSSRGRTICNCRGYECGYDCYFHCGGFFLVADLLLVFSAGNVLMYLEWVCGCGFKRRVVQCYGGGCVGVGWWIGVGLIG